MSARFPPTRWQTALGAATSSNPSNKSSGVYGHANFTLAMDTGDPHAVHGLPPNDSIDVGRVVVYARVAWAMATLDRLFYRTQRRTLLTRMHALPMLTHGHATAPRGNGARQFGW